MEVLLIMDTTTAAGIGDLITNGGLAGFLVVMLYMNYRLFSEFKAAQDAHMNDLREIAGLKAALGNRPITAQSASPIQKA